MVWLLVMKKTNLKFIIKLAFKNLSRYKKRTILTATAIGVALLTFILIDSLLLGAEVESVRNLREYETSDIRITTPSYYQDRLFKPLQYAIEDVDLTLNSLKENNYTSAPRISFLAEMIIYDENYFVSGSTNVNVTAVDPLIDKKLFAFDKTITEGSYLTDNSHQVVLGSFLAEDIGATVGSEITLVTQTIYGSFETIDLEVVGISSSPNPNISRSLVMIPLEIARDYLDMEKMATEINISLSFNSNLEKEQLKIQSIVPNNLKVSTWQEFAGDYLALAEAKRGGSALILFLVFVIAAVGISNTLLMAIYERVREMGMMRAMGMREKEIRLLFVFEAGAIALIGSIGALILSIAANFYIVKFGFDFSALMREIDIGYRIASRMRGTWNWKALLVSPLIATLMSMVFAYFFSLRASKISITKSLGHN